MVFIPAVGHVAVATLTIPASVSGYIAVEAGEQIVIRHIGAGDSERGWVYVTRVTSPQDAGWLPVQAVLPPREMRRHPHNHAHHPIVCARRGIAPFPSAMNDADDGFVDYLAPVTTGERLEILRTGSSQSKHDGFAYVRRVNNPKDEGWVLLDVVQADDVEDDTDEDDDDVILAERHQLGPQDVAFHLRPKQGSSQLRAEPNPRAESLGSVPHNQRVTITHIAGTWANVLCNNEVGWVRRVFLRDTPLPPSVPRSSRSSLPKRAVTFELDS